VITCPKCAKDNQDHYKFCLGCGAELPRDAAPKPFAPQTPPHGMRTGAQAQSAGGGAAQARASAAPAAVSAAAPAPMPIAAPVPASIPFGGAPAQAGGPPPMSAAASPSGGTVLCPQCGHVNTPHNQFCGSCGFRLSGATKAPAAPAAPVEAGGGCVLTALRADGSEAGTYRLPPGTVIVGRETGAIFGGDSYLSPRHATFFQPGPGQLRVKDEDSLNGVYKKLARDVPVELKPNDVFRIGQEIIRFEPLATQPPSADGVERLGAPSKGYVGRIALVIGRDATGNAFPVPESGVQLGRERGDILFPEDGYVSGLHCRLTYENGKLTMVDLGSSNGSFIRLSEETALESGDVLLMGQQLFRIAL
jgi:pSer/pThr/pTyr-binding forkhead associated (FHA) protein